MVQGGQGKRRQRVNKCKKGQGERGKRDDLSSTKDGVPCPSLYPSGILYLRRETIIWSFELPRPRIYITLLSRSRESDKACHFVGVHIRTRTHTRVRNARNSGDENPDNNFDRESRRTCGLRLRPQLIRVNYTMSGWNRIPYWYWSRASAYTRTRTRTRTRTVSFLYIVRVIKATLRREG